MKNYSRLVFVIASLLIVVIHFFCCKGSQTRSRSIECVPTEVPDSLNDVYERMRVGDYVYEVYNGVSCPGAVTLRDSLGRVVAEYGFDGSGAESYMSFFYDEEGRLASIYWGGGIEFSNFSDSSDNITREVEYLTVGCKKDANATSFIFERNSQGKIVSVHSGTTKDQIMCIAGGEITYYIYKYDGCAVNGSLLRQGGYLEIEFYVKNPKDGQGNWEEITYCGYDKTQYRKYVSNKPDKAEALSPSTGITLAMAQCTISGDSLLMDIENFVDSLYDHMVFVDNQLLVAEKKSRWGTTLEKKKYELTSSGEIICNCEKYDYSAKALKSMPPYRVEKNDVDLTTCFRNLFENM